MYRIMSNKSGFTLIELVIVIVILGILASLALPKFVDLITDAKISATKGGLGALRAVIALKYSKNIAGGTTPYYPSTITTGDFFDGKLPSNKLLSDNATSVNVLSAIPAGTNPTVATTTIGWWYVNAGADAGRAGAYSDGTQDMSTW